MKVRYFSIMVLLIFAISMAVPVSALTYVDKLVICADDPEGYKDYTPHYQWKGYDNELVFPPGATIYVYIEEKGKTKEDTKTGQFTPNIGFKMEGVSPTGRIFSASTTSSKRINDDKTPYKKTYGVVKFTTDKDILEGKYRINFTTIDNNDGNRLVGNSPNIYFTVKENATLYPPYDFSFKDLTITPNPINLGQAVTVSVNVTNIGGKGDTKGENITLSIDGDEIVTKLHIEDEETEEVDFKLTKKELDSVGVYNITIGDLNDTLVVQETASSSSSGDGGSDGGTGRTPGFEVIYAISGIALVVYLMSRKRGK